MKNYNARKEPIDAYISRLTRQATALETLEHPLGSGVLGTLIEKARYDERLYQDAADDPIKAALD